MRILIALPHNYNGFEVPFVMSLVGMQDNFFEWVIKNKREDTISIVRQSGYQIDEMRNNLVDVAKEYKMTHILFLDTDMSFPADMIARMIEDFEDNKDADAITGLYVRKTPPYLPHVYPSFMRTKKYGIAGLFPLDSIFPVAGAGLGCVMIKTSVFKKKPYFKMGGAIDGAKGLGEDLYFFAKFKPRTYCDTRIKCVHYKTNGVSVDTYIQHNGLSVKEGQINGTKEQILAIADEYKKIK